MFSIIEDQLSSGKINYLLKLNDEETLSKLDVPYSVKLTNVLGILSILIDDYKSIVKIIDIRLNVINQDKFLPLKRTLLKIVLCRLINYYYCFEIDIDLTNKNMMNILGEKYENTNVLINIKTFLEILSKEILFN